MEDGSKGFVLSPAAPELTKGGYATFDWKVQGIPPFLLVKVAPLPVVRPRSDGKN